MPELKWLDGYSGQTVDELLALEGKWRTDSIVEAFHQAVQQKWGRVGEDALSLEKRMIFAIAALEAQVNNGGYKQFFENSSREYTPIMASTLERIGCPKVAEITRKAIDALHLPFVTIEAFEAALAADSYDEEELDRCDQTFFAAREDIADKLLAFIKANPHPITL
jgi:hypothetical protein